VCLASTAEPMAPDCYAQDAGSVWLEPGGVAYLGVSLRATGLAAGDAVVGTLGIHATPGQQR